MAATGLLSFGKESLSNRFVGGHVGPGEHVIGLAARVFRDQRESASATGIGVRTRGEIKLAEPLVQRVQPGGVRVVLRSVAVAGSVPIGRRQQGIAQDTRIGS